LAGPIQLHQFFSRTMHVHVHRSNEVFNIQIAGIETTVILDIFKLFWLEPTAVIIPHFPQLEAELVNSTQRSPVAEQFLRCFD